MLFNLHLQGPVQLYNVTHVLGELTHISSDCILVLNYILTTSLPEVFHYLRCASLIPAVSHLFALGIQLFAGQSAPFMKLIKQQAKKISATFIPKRKISALKIVLERSLSKGRDVRWSLEQSLCMCPFI